MVAKPGQATDWIGRNLWAILAVAFGLWGGYVTGQSETNSRLTNLERDVARHEAKLRGRTDFMVCTVRNMDKLFDEHDKPPPCPMGVPE